AGRRTAHRARVPGRMLAGVAAAVALIQAARVPVARARRSGGLLRIGRTGRARARARVGEVAFTRARTAGRAGVAGRMRADVALAVALIRAARIAVVGARGPCRTLGVRRAARRRPGAVLCRVALATRGPAGGGRRLEGVGRTRGARPGAALGHVAGSGRRAARRPSVARRVLAEVARAVALVRAARVAVIGAGRPRRALRVGRAGRARAGAVLRRVALAGRGATERAGVARRMLAGVARPVALVRAAGVTVVGAGRAGRTLGVRGARRGRPGAVLRRIALAGREPAGRRRRLERVGRTRRARAGAVLVHVAGTRR